MGSTLTYRLKPTEHFCTSAGAEGIGLHPSAGHSSQQAGDCATATDEGQDALDETDYGYLQSRGIAGLYLTGRFEYTFGGLPSGLTISKVRIVAYLRMSNAGNESPDESPRVKGFVNPAGTRRYQTSPAYVTVVEACNRNTQNAQGTFGRYICGEWANNPETASAWTLTDLAPGAIMAGVEAGGIAEGQAGNGVPPTTGGTQASLDLASIELEVEATSSELVTEPIRAQSSRLLRLRRRALKPVRLEVPVTLAHAEPGEVVYAADPFWPTPDAEGLTLLDWSRRPLHVIESEERIGAHQATLTAWDLREHYCSFWSPLHTDLGADDQWNGLAYVDQGLGKSVVRAQGGWIWRPGDGLWRDAGSGSWRITPWGLLICGGTYAGSSANTGETTWHALNDTFSQGTGGEGASLANADTTGLSSWTVTKVGAATVVIKADSSYLFDVVTYRRAVRITTGAPYASNYAYMTQAVAGFATTQRVRIGIKFRMVTGSLGAVNFLLRRTTAPTDWSESLNSWTVASMWNPVDTGDPGRASLRQIGDHFEYWSSDITVGGTGAQTLTLALGYVTEDSASVDIFAAAVISTGSATGAGAPVLRREFMATTGSSLGQAADIIDLANGGDVEPIYDTTRGTLTLVATPLWDHEDLSDGAKKYILESDHDLDVAHRDQLYYERTNATTGKWVFGRTVTGTARAEYATSAAAGTLPRYWSPVKLSARWTSASGELGLAPYSVSIFRNGQAGTTAVASGSPGRLSSAFVALGRTAGALGGAIAPSSFLDGMIAHLETVPICLSDTEIARRHAQLSMLTLPAAI